MRLILGVMIALAFAPLAVAQPPGIKAVDGMWATEDGRPIFVYARYGSSPVLCEAPCQSAGQWIPLPASANIDVDGQWRAVNNNSGRQWSYRDSLLYTFNGEWTEEQDAKWRARGWRKAPAMQDGAAKRRVVEADDPALAAGPLPMRGVKPDYPPASLRTGEQGVVLVRLCVDETGAGQYPQLGVSSGARRLDAATLEWAWRARFSPAQMGQDPVAVCGAPLELVWAIPSLVTPEQQPQ